MHPADLRCGGSFSFTSFIRDRGQLELLVKAVCTVSNGIHLSTPFYTELRLWLPFHRVSASRRVPCDGCHGAMQGGARRRRRATTRATPTGATGSRERHK